MAFVEEKDWELNKKKHISGTFSDGKKAGVFEFRDTNGKLLYKVNYDEDVITKDAEVFNSAEAKVSEYSIKNDGIKNSVHFFSENDTKLAEFELLSKVHTQDEWRDYNLPPVGEYLHIAAEEVIEEDNALTSFSLYLPIICKSVQREQKHIFLNDDRASIFAKFVFGVNLRMSDIANIYRQATSQEDFDRRFLTFLNIKHRLITGNHIFDDKTDNIKDEIMRASEGKFNDFELYFSEDPYLEEGHTFGWTSGGDPRELVVPTVVFNFIGVKDRNPPADIAKLDKINFTEYGSYVDWGYPSYAYMWKHNHKELDGAIEKWRASHNVGWGWAMDVSRHIHRKDFDGTMWTSDEEAYKPNWRQVKPFENRQNKLCYSWQTNLTPAFWSDVLGSPDHLTPYIWIEFKVEVIEPDGNSRWIDRNIKITTRPQFYGYDLNSGNTMNNERHRFGIATNVNYATIPYLIPEKLHPDNKYRVWHRWCTRLNPETKWISHPDENAVLKPYEWFKAFSAESQITYDSDDWNYWFDYSKYKHLGPLDNPNSIAPIWLYDKFVHAIYSNPTPATVSNYLYIDLPKQIHTGKFYKLETHLQANNYKAFTFKQVRYIQRHPAELYPGTTWELISTDFKLTDSEVAYNIAEPATPKLPVKPPITVDNGIVKCRLEFEIDSVVPEFDKMYRLDVHGESKNSNKDVIIFRRLLIPLTKVGDKYKGIVEDVRWVFPTTISKDLRYTVKAAIITPYGRSDELEVPLSLHSINVPYQPNTEQYNRVLGFRKVATPKSYEFFDVSILADRYFHAYKSVYLWKRVSSSYGVGPYLYNNAFKEYYDNVLARDGRYALNKNKYNDFFCALDGSDIIYQEDGTSKLLERIFSNGKLNNRVKLYDKTGKLYHDLLLNPDKTIKKGVFHNFNTDEWNPSIKYIRDPKTGKYKVFKGNIESGDFNTIIPSEFPPKKPAEPYNNNGEEYLVITEDDVETTVTIPVHDIELVFNWGLNTQGNNYITKYKISNSLDSTVNGELVFKPDNTFNISAIVREAYERASIARLFTSIPELAKRGSINPWQHIAYVDIAVDRNENRVEKKVFLNGYLKYGANTGLGILRDKKRIEIDIHYTEAKTKVVGEAEVPKEDIGGYTPPDKDLKDAFKIDNFIWFGSLNRYSTKIETYNIVKDLIDLDSNIVHCGTMLNDIKISTADATASGLDSRLVTLMGNFNNMVPFIKGVEIIPENPALKVSSTTLPFDIKFNDNFELSLTRGKVLNVKVLWKTYDEYIKMNNPYKADASINFRFIWGPAEDRRELNKSINLHDLWIYYRNSTDVNKLMADGQTFTDKYGGSTPLNILFKSNSKDYDILKGWVVSLANSSTHDLITKSKNLYNSYDKEVIWDETNSKYVLASDTDTIRKDWVYRSTMGYFISDKVNTYRYEDYYKLMQSNRIVGFDVDEALASKTVCIVDSLNKYPFKLILHWRASYYYTFPTGWSEIDKSTNEYPRATEVDIRLLNAAKINALKGHKYDKHYLIYTPLINNIYNAFIKTKDNQPTILPHIDEAEWYDVSGKTPLDILTKHATNMLKLFNNRVQKADAAKYFGDECFNFSDPVIYIPAVNFDWSLSSDIDGVLVKRIADRTLWIRWDATPEEMERHSPYFSVRNTDAGRVKIRMNWKDNDLIKETVYDLHSMWMDLYKKRLIRPKVKLKDLAQYSKGHDVNVAIGNAYCDWVNGSSSTSNINNYFARFSDIPEFWYSRMKIPGGSNLDNISKILSACNISDMTKFKRTVGMQTGKILISKKPLTQHSYYDLYVNHNGTESKKIYDNHQYLRFAWLNMKSGVAAANNGVKIILDNYIGSTLYVAPEFMLPFDFWLTKKKPMTYNGDKNFTPNGKITLPARPAPNENWGNHDTVNDSMHISRLLAGIIGYQFLFTTRSNFNFTNLDNYKNMPAEFKTRFNNYKSNPTFDNVKACLKMLKDEVPHKSKIYCNMTYATRVDNGKTIDNEDDLITEFGRSDMEYNISRIRISTILSIGNSWVGKTGLTWTNKNRADLFIYSNYQDEPRHIITILIDRGNNSGEIFKLKDLIFSKAPSASLEAIHLYDASKYEKSGLIIGNVWSQRFYLSKVNFTKPITKESAIAENIRLDVPSSANYWRCNIYGFQSDYNGVMTISIYNWVAHDKFPYVIKGGGIVSGVNQIIIRNGNRARSIMSQFTMPAKKWTNADELNRTIKELSLANLTSQDFKYVVEYGISAERRNFARRVVSDKGGILDPISYIDKPYRRGKDD